MKPEDGSSKKYSRKPTRDAEGSIIKKIEEKRTTGEKTRKVTIFYARVRYTDKDGKKREKKRACESYNDAVIKRRELQNEIEKELTDRSEESERPKTIGEVLNFFEEEFVKAAIYSNEQKIEGYRENLENARRHIKLFRAAFGIKLVTRLTYDDIRRLKTKRLATPVKVTYYEKVELTEAERAILPKSSRRRFKRVKGERISDRKIASVNRELARLRRILNIAVRQGWLTINPFNQGESLIQTSLEEERLRIAG